MNKQEEFYAKLEELKAIYDAKMQEQSDALGEYPQEDEWPKYGNDYFYISDSGFIESDCNCNNREDLHRLKTGNIFRTKEEAEYHLHMIDLAYKYRKLGFEPDWNDLGCWKWHNVYDCKEDVFENLFGIIYPSRRTHFATVEQAKQALELIPVENRAIDFLYMLNRGMI